MRPCRGSRTRQDHLVLIHLDQVDYAGHHEGGAASPNWAAAARRSDDLLREIVGTLDLTKDTLLVTSDHGHLDRGNHGGPEPILLLEPFVLAGAGVQPGTYGDTNQVDTAPTLAACSAQTSPPPPRATYGPRCWRYRLRRAGARHPRRGAEASAGAGLRRGHRPASSAHGSHRRTQAAQAMAAAQDARLSAERLPRLIVGILVLAALAFALIRVARSDARLGPRRRGRLSRRLQPTLCLSQPPHLFADHGDRRERADLYVLVTTLLAFVIGLARLCPGHAAVLRRPPDEAARLTLGWALLDVAITGLPRCVSFVLNGPLIGWTLPEFWTFFVGFLATLQMLVYRRIRYFVCRRRRADCRRLRRPAARVSLNRP